MQLQPDISANGRANLNEVFLVMKRKFMFNNLLSHFRDYKAEWVSPVQVEKINQKHKQEVKI
jgi:hypothetical protein